jgi:hypothetical protein
MDERNQALPPAQDGHAGGGAPVDPAPAPAAEPRGYARDQLAGTTASAPTEAAWRPADPFAGAAAPPAEGLDTRRGLAAWLALLLVVGLGGIAVGQAEAAGLAALAGLFIAAQAADLDPRWKLLYWMLTWVVPIGSALAFAATIALALESDLAAPAQLFMAAYGAAAAGACLLLVARPVVDPVAVRLFREDPPTHALRLATRLAVAGLLIAAPGALLFRDKVLQLLSEDGHAITTASLAGQMVGMVLVALAAVGFLVRRGWRDTLERLGLTRPTAWHLVLGVTGAGALAALNAAAEQVQRALFPELWARDRAVAELIGAGMGVPQALLLGLSAGVGEEVTLRGALQPRLGIVLTAALFAALHVQYSWFGMLVIFAFGALLGLLRARSTTTVVILVHALYDVYAVLSG